MQPAHFLPEQSELIKKAQYESQYNPDKLFPISRKLNRDAIGVPELLPFYGYDLWNHYEVSWLDNKGKPIAALAEILYDCDSKNIIESKSMKLYFNTFNNTNVADAETMRATVEKDISERIGGAVKVKIIPMSDYRDEKLFAKMQGVCIDHLDVKCEVYSVDPSLLSTENEVVAEALYSDLLKSNCLVTNQPDWGSVYIVYKGKKINHESLLRYIVSYRNCNEFAEQCVERIFMDITRQCQPQELTVYARYTRRGGLDINPFRTSKRENVIMDNSRLSRQ